MNVFIFFGGGASASLKILALAFLLLGNIKHLRQCLLQQTCVGSAHHLRTEVWVYIHTGTNPNYWQLWHTISWYKMAAALQFKHYSCSWSKLSLHQFSKINVVPLYKINYFSSYIGKTIYILCFVVRFSGGAVLHLFVWIQFITNQQQKNVMPLWTWTCPHVQIDL